VVLRPLQIEFFRNLLEVFRSKVVPGLPEDGCEAGELKIHVGSGIGCMRPSRNMYAHLLKPVQKLSILERRNASR